VGSDDDRPGAPAASTAVGQPPAELVGQGGWEIFLWAHSASSAGPRADGRRRLPREILRL